MKCVLVLDNIRSVYNVGAIFRTAEAIGVEKIYLCGITPGPLDRFGRARKDFHKSALGAEENVSWERIESVKEMIQDLRFKIYEWVALEQDERAMNYKDYKLVKDFALVLGQEVEGIGKDVLDLCDKIIEIPMRGRKESLNVSVAAGVALFSLLDQ
ncbi:MAG TPA: TrmH family RNA methyltransferase [Candidatus Paceibacterota bacterium]